MKISKYFQIYKSFLEINVAEALIYRLHFCFLILFEAVFFLTLLGSVEVMLLHTETIGGWPKENILFFICFMLCVDHLHMTFVSENIWIFSENIRTGKLDYDLLRPAATPFVVFFKNIRMGTLVVLPFLVLPLCYYGSMAGLSGASWLLLPIFILLALALLTVLEFCIATLLFWTVGNDGINYIRINLQALGRWPAEVYIIGIRTVFTTVFPILLVGTAPVAFLLDQGAWPKLTAMVFALIIFCFIGRMLWKAGLRRYESASS